VQYFSQQAVGRLLAVAGVEMDSEMTLPEKLRRAQEMCGFVRILERRYVDRQECDRSKPIQNKRRREP